MTSHATTAAPAATGLTRALPVLAGLTVLNLLLQFITAGQLFGENAPERLHGGGAIALHVLSGLTAIVAFLLWRRGQTSLRLVVLAAVVFVATFVQAALGGYDTLWAHVPGAMILTVGAVWVLVDSLRNNSHR